MQVYCNEQANRTPYTVYSELYTSFNPSIFSQTEYGDVLYNIGLIDFNQKLVFQDRSKQTRDAIANKASQNPR